MTEVPHRSRRLATGHRAFRRGISCTPAFRRMCAAHDPRPQTFACSPSSRPNICPCRVDALVLPAVLWMEVFVVHVSGPTLLHIGPLLHPPVVLCVSVWTSSRKVVASKSAAVLINKLVVTLNVFLLVGGVDL